MKKSTCKVLLGIAIFWIFLMLIVNLSMLLERYITFRNIINQPLFYIAFFSSNFPAIILIIISIFKWNSEKEK